MTISERVKEIKNCIKRMQIVDNVNNIVNLIEIRNQLDAIEDAAPRTPGAERLTTRPDRDA